MNIPLVVARTAIKYAGNIYGAKTGMVRGVKTSPNVVPHSIWIWAQPNRSIKVQVSHAECQLWHLEKLNRLNTSCDFDRQSDGQCASCYEDKDAI